jgi:phosphatidylglycerophosphate synthase
MDPYLDRVGLFLVKLGWNANTVTFAGLLFGLLAMVAITQGEYLWGLVAIVLNRLCDGLDGAIARQTRLTDLGGYIDIVFDFIIYAGIVFAFAVSQPEFAIWYCFLLFSYMGAASSFLAYAIVASKKKMMISTKRGKKSFHYLGGLSEGFETIVTMVLLCLFPQQSSNICLVYGLMCLATTIGRVWQSYVDFKEI